MKLREMGSPQSEELAAILKQLNKSTKASHLSSAVIAPGQAYNDIAGGQYMNTEVDQRIIRNHPQSSDSIPDSSRIISWIPAREFVVDHVYPDSKSAAKIKLLIKSQHLRERQWWQEREALLAKQRARIGKKKDVQAILRTFGGNLESEATINLGDDIAELETCDKRIYSEMVKLAAENDRNLRSMRVPFFSVKHELVILEPEGHGRKDKLDRSQLKELQKRMLQLLQDLFQD